MEFTHFRCPDCGGEVKEVIVVNKEADALFKKTQELDMLSKEELKIVLELNQAQRPITAKDLASEVDIDSRHIAYICRKMDEDKGLIKRESVGGKYKYSLTEQGMKYCTIKYM